MKAALSKIEHDPHTIREYADKLIPLIYGENKPSFNDAFGTFKVVANKLLDTL